MQQKNRETFIKEKYTHMLGMTINDLKSICGEGKLAYSGYSSSFRIIYDNFQVNYDDAGLIFSITGSAMEICNLDYKKEVTIEDITARLGLEPIRNSVFSYMWVDCGIPNTNFIYKFGDVELVMRIE